MTKQEKIEKMLAASMTVSDGVLAAMRKEQPEIAKRIDAHPELVKELQVFFVKAAMPYFEPMGDGALDSALAFFTSPAGAEYHSLSVAALPKLAPMIQKAVAEFVVKLFGTKP